MERVVPGSRGPPKQVVWCDGYGGSVCWGTPWWQTVVVATGTVISATIAAIGQLRGRLLGFRRGGWKELLSSHGSDWQWVLLLWKLSLDLDVWEVLNDGVGLDVVITQPDMTKDPDRVIRYLKMNKNNPFNIQQNHEILKQILSEFKMPMKLHEIKLRILTLNQKP